VIDAATQLVGLVGWPLHHSVSPAMHNAAFAALGLNWCYVPLPTPPGAVEVALRGLAGLGFRGANVTVPHKSAAMAVVDSIADNARKIGAVNTVVTGCRADGTLLLGGYNTDDRGCVAALRHAGWEPEEGGRAVLVGAGGAARAVAFGLLWSGTREVVVLNRDPARADALTSELSCLHSWPGKLRSLPLSPETLVESARAADLLIHATPVGTWPRANGSIWPSSAPVPAHLAVFDLVYNPTETQLLRQARESGAHPIGGLEMLVRQGALSFEMWTGESPPVDVMRRAAQEALSR
jgi:shikimate dehydrogenase